MSNTDDFLKEMDAKLDTMDDIFDDFTLVRKRRQDIDELRHIALKLQTDENSDVSLIGAKLAEICRLITELGVSKNLNNRDSIKKRLKIGKSCQTILNAFRRYRGEV